MYKYLLIVGFLAPRRGKRCVHVTLNFNVGAVITFPRLPSSNIQQPTNIHPQTTTSNPVYYTYYTRINWCSDWASLCRIMPSLPFFISSSYAFFNLFNLLQGPVKDCPGCFVSDPSSAESKCFMYVTSTPVLATITTHLALLRRHSPHHPLTHPPPVLDVTAACDTGPCP